MKQTLVTSYVFNASAQTLDLSSVVGFDVKRLYAVINITANQVIYAVGIPAYGVSLVSGSVITLVYNTTAMSNTDKLMIVYDTVNTDIANAFVTKNTDGTNSQTYTGAGEAKVLVTPLTNSSIVKAQLQDNSGSAITLGQKIMASSVPVAIASDQSAIPVSQSGVWAAGRTWNLSSGADSVASVQSGTWATRIQDASGNALTSTTGALNVNVSGGSLDIGTADKSTFTYGTSIQQAIGAVFQDTSPTLTAGQNGALRSTSQRGLHVNLRDSSGNEKLAQQTSALSIPVVIASDQSAVPASQSGSWDIRNITGTVSLPTNAAQETGGHLASLDGKFNSLGQKTSANSAPVVIASDQSAIPASQSGNWDVRNVTGTVSLPTNAAQETGGHLASIDTKLGTGPTAQDSTLANVQGSASGGTAASKSDLVGGIFNTAFPTLTNGQQSAIQLDSSARQIIAPLTNASIVKAQLQDNSGSAITLGQKVMASSVPVTIASDQSAISVSQSGTWTTGRTWTLASGTDSVSAVQSGTWTVAQGTAAALSGKWPVQVTDGTNTMPTMDTAARAGFQKITDGTNTAAVKAASTAAAVADPSLVVAMSPNVAGTTAVSGSQYMNVFNPSEGTTGSAVPARSMQVAGSDGTNLRTLNTDTSGNLYTNPAAVSFANITTATTTTVKSGAGKLIALNVNTGVANATITIYNNTAGSGTKIATITLQGGGAGVQAFALDYKYLPFSTGLTIVTSGATDITVIYQ